MDKQKFEVIRAWSGVSVGQVVELAEPIHPALKANVRKVGTPVEGGPATAQAGQIIADATQVAAALVEAATAQAEQIIADATAQSEAAKLQAEQIVGDAYAEAEKIKGKK